MKTTASAAVDVDADSSRPRIADSSAGARDEDDGHLDSPLAATDGGTGKVRVTLQGNAGEELHAVLTENPELRRVKGKGLMKIWSLQTLDAAAGAAEDEVPSAEALSHQQSIDDFGDGSSTAATEVVPATSHASDEPAGSNSPWMADGESDSGERRDGSRQQRQRRETRLLVQQGNRSKGHDGTSDFFQNLKRAHDDPHHWRFKFSGFVHYKPPTSSMERDHIKRKSECCLDHSIHGIQRPPRVELAQLDEMAEQKVSVRGGLYDGLEDLPYEEYLFNVERPYHPLYLTYYNPKLEKLYQNRRRCHRLQYRAVGALAFTILSLVSFLIDLPLFAECDGCHVFLASVSAGLALQILALVILGWPLWAVVGEKATAEGEFPLHISNGLYDLTLVLHVLATYFVLVASSRIFPESESELAMSGKGLLQIHCFPRISLLLVISGVDAAWKIPRLCHAFAIGVVLLVQFAIDHHFLGRHDPAGALCGEEDAFETHEAALQSYFPIVASVLSLWYSMRLKEEELRRRLCSIIHSQLLRSKVELAVRSLLPPHVLKAQMQAVIDSHQTSQNKPGAFSRLPNGSASRNGDGQQALSNQGRSMGNHQSTLRKHDGLLKGLGGGREAARPCLQKVLGNGHFGISQVKWKKFLQVGNLMLLPFQGLPRTNLQGKRMQVPVPAVISQLRWLQAFVPSIFPTLFSSWPISKGSHRFQVT